MAAARLRGIRGVGLIAAERRGAGVGRTQAPRLGKTAIGALGSTFPATRSLRPTTHVRHHARPDRPWGKRLARRCKAATSARALAALEAGSTRRRWPRDRSCVLRSRTSVANPTPRAPIAYRRELAAVPLLRRPPPGGSEQLIPRSRLSWCAPSCECTSTGSRGPRRRGSVVVRALGATAPEQLV